MADLGTDRLTWRRLGLLIRHLPSDSATYAEIHGPQAAWRVTDYLLANVADQLAGANWQRGGGKGRRPQPLPRPRSAVEQRARKREMERMAAKHADWKKRRKVSGG